MILKKFKTQLNLCQIGGLQKLFGNGRRENHHQNGERQKWRGNHNHSSTNATGSRLATHCYTSAVLAAAEVPAKETSPEEETDNYITVKSLSIIGTFYRKPSPDKPVFGGSGNVNVGFEN